MEVPSRLRTASRARLSAICLSAALLAGCGGAASQPAASGGPAAAPAQTSAAGSAAPKALKKVTLRLPWTIGGYDVPFVYGAAKGYFKAAGFDVSVQEGKGSSVTAQTVGNGSDQFGFADAGTSANLISKGDPIKVLAVFVQDSPMSFIHNPSIKITSPKDIIGHPIITSAGDADKQILPAVLAKYGMNESQLKFDMVSPSAYAGTFVKTPGAIMLGFNNDDLQNVQKIDPKAIATPYSQFGVNLYNTGLITSDKLLQSDPAEVKAFVAASVKSWNATIADPTAAVQATLKAFPQASKRALTGGLDQTLKMLHTPATKGHVLGWMAKSDWQETVTMLNKYGGLKPVKPLSDYYTNAYLPK